MRGIAAVVPTRSQWVMKRLNVVGIYMILNSKYKSKPNESMGAVCAVKTKLRIPLTWTWCQHFHYDCLSCLSCDASLPYLVWLSALHSHIFLYNYVLNMSFLCSALQLALAAWHKVFPLFSKDDAGEEQHFVSLSSLFSSPLPSPSPPLVTFSCCLLFHPPSSCLALPSHHLLSLSPNDLIPPAPLHLSSRVWSNFSVEVTRRVWMWQRRFLLVSTWAG